MTVNSIAKWDGSNWSALSGSTGLGVNGSVKALAVFDDGTGTALYAGGGFTEAGGLQANCMAHWDGGEWHQLAGPAGIGVSGNDPSVSALAVFDDGTGAALYAGGPFFYAGGVYVSFIARWNGSAWSALSGPSGVGAEGVPRALAVYDDGTGAALYVGGAIWVAGGVPVESIARWDGTAWSALNGGGFSGGGWFVDALAVHDDGSGSSLYAGGSFVTAAGLVANNIAKWDGVVWSVLDGSYGIGVNRSIATIGEFDDGSGPALYVGGELTMAGGMPAHYIARWSGSSWSALTSASSSGVDDAVLSFTSYDDGSGPALFVGGHFATAGAVVVNGVAEWDGSAWSALGGPSGTGVDRDGTVPFVYDLEVFDDASGPALYVGGVFTTAGGTAASNVARWDGSTWSPLAGPSGNGVNLPIRALAVYDDGSGPALYAGGNFSRAGGVSAGRIAKWNGVSWSALSDSSFSGVNDEVWALAVYDDGSGPALFVAGRFYTAGGVVVNNVARWNGSEWSALTGASGSGLSDRAQSLAVHDDGTGPALYVGGLFITAGGVAVNHIARWDGTTWSALSGPSGIGLSGGPYVYSLGSTDDNAAPVLFAGGAFTTAGGLTVNNIALWDGTTWSPLNGPMGTGVSSSTYALVTMGEGLGRTLYAGGSFTTAGGLPSSRLAAWSCGAGVFADGFELGDTSQWSATIQE